MGKDLDNVVVFFCAYDPRRYQNIRQNYVTAWLILVSIRSGFVITATEKALKTTHVYFCLQTFRQF